MRFNRLWIVVPAMVAVPPALAEEAEPLVIGRPDFVGTSTAEREGVFQFEITWAAS
jgi:hypothetical protein